ncbi:hypothetical protein [Actinomadura nitritigenes]|uniref:hypothetical protein n=1 Tax=Actinomadura nitritigenes TaxID=134602 RepID=UPI003D92B237
MSTAPPTADRGRMVPGNASDLPPYRADGGTDIDSSLDMEPLSAHNPVAVIAQHDPDASLEAATTAFRTGASQHLDLFPEHVEFRTGLPTSTVPTIVVSAALGRLVIPRDHCG